MTTSWELKFIFTWLGPHGTFIIDINKVRLYELVIIILFRRLDSLVLKAVRFSQHLYLVCICSLRQLLLINRLSWMIGKTVPLINQLSLKYSMINYESENTLGSIVICSPIDCEVLSKPFSIRAIEQGEFYRIESLQHVINACSMSWQVYKYKMEILI